MRRASAALFAMILLASSPYRAIAQQGSARTGFESIRVEDLRRHLSVLASDSLEGRETASLGQRKAASYIASVFESLGLVPAGDSGTYFQNFEVSIESVDPSSRVDVLAGQEKASLSWGKDFLALTSASCSLNAHIVFIGYMDAPLDSAQALELQDAFVLAFAGRRSDAEASFSSRQRRRFGRQFPGSLGTIVIVDEQKEESFEGLTSSLRSWLEGGSMSLPQASDTPRRGGRPTLYVSMSAATRLLSSSGHDAHWWKDRARQETPLAPVLLQRTTCTVSLAMASRTAMTQNVIGFVRGSDPDAASDAVAFSAHYDHLGRSATRGIYHGADDDGSGTAMLLELAEAYATTAQHTRRTALFIAVTGEEKGLLGSEYYVSHPTWPLEQTVADLNIDMIGRIDEPHASMTSGRYVYIIGSDKISPALDSLVQHVNRTTVNLALDYTYNDDRDPNQFYRRSDHYNFARNGIPVVFFFSGVHEDYHQVTDTIDKIRFDKMVPIGQLIYQTGWELLERTEPLRRLHPLAP